MQRTRAKSLFEMRRQAPWIIASLTILDQELAVVAASPDLRRSSSVTSERSDQSSLGLAFQVETPWDVVDALTAGGPPRTSTASRRRCHEANGVVCRRPLKGGIADRWRAWPLQMVSATTRRCSSRRGLHATDDALKICSKLRPLAQGRLITAGAEAIATERSVPSWAPWRRG
jgi:hypothetical protein